MRTPGRCTNEQACWMADASRDIFVRLGDPFNCPACGSRLSPPIQAIAGRSRAVSAMAGCVAFVVATGIGIGLVPLTRTAAASVNMDASMSARYASQMGSSALVAPPVEVELGSVTLTTATELASDQSAHTISYGKPVGPEDEDAAPVRHWHHRAARHYGFTGFLPAPADAPAEQADSADAAPAT